MFQMVKISLFNFFVLVRHNENANDILCLQVVFFLVSNKANNAHFLSL